jgi:membrane protein
VAAASHWRFTDGSLIDPYKFWNFMGILIPIIMSILAFTILYRYLPSRNIGNVAPIIGGATAGLLFELAKYIYRIFVVNFANYHVVYGSLGSVVLLVIWTYYVSVIAILGAEVTSTYATYRSGYSKKRYNE